MNIIKNFLVGIVMLMGVILIGLILSAIIQEMPIIINIIIAISAIVVIYGWGVIIREWRK